MTRQRAGASRPKAPPVSDGAGSSSARKRSNEPGPSEEAKQPAQDVVELEKKREAVADELRHVEQQVGSWQGARTRVKVEERHRLLHESPVHCTGLCREPAFSIA